MIASKKILQWSKELIDSYQHIEHPRARSLAWHFQMVTPAFQHFHLEMMNFQQILYYSLDF